MNKKTIAYVSAVFCIIVLVCGFIYKIYHAGNITNPKVSEDIVQRVDEVGFDRLTVKDCRKSDDDAYVQIAVIGVDGNPVKLSYIMFRLCDDPEARGFADFPRRVESVLVALAEKAPEEYDGGATVSSNKSYYWSYGGEDNVSHEGGVVTTPLLVPGQKKYSLALRPALKKKVSPSLVDITGTLPPDCPLDSPMYAGYFLNGRLLGFDLPTGERKFNIRVPAYGGELSVEDVQRSLSVLYNHNVAGPSIGTESHRAISKARKYKVVVTADRSPTVLEFLNRKNSHIPVGGTRIASGATTAEVLLIPGVYWVRRATLEQDRDLNEKPFVMVDTEKQEVLDFSKNTEE